MGDEIQFSSDLTLTATSPRAAHLRLIRNGQLIMERKGWGLEMLLTESGIYRLEVRLEEKPWIFTNPIYIRGQGTGSRDWV